MKKFFCSKDGMRNYLTNNDPEPDVRPYAQDSAFKNAFIERMRRDGFDGPLCWYKASTFNYQYDCDKQLPEDRDKVTVPALYIGAKEDVVCRPEGMQPAIDKGLLPKLERAEMLDAGHWTPFEKPDEVAEYIGAWLKKNYA
jgi:soluble epoxide hydrolase/lipid-phosphate phosphatase